LRTPITKKFYINSKNDGVYGTEKTLNQIGSFSFKPNSEIQNLVLHWASIASRTIAGVRLFGGANSLCSFKPQII
jgi:all-trans-retinol 13,14-reductase